MKKSYVLLCWVLIISLMVLQGCGSGGGKSSKKIRIIETNGIGSALKKSINKEDGSPIPTSTPPSIVEIQNKYFTFAAYTQDSSYGLIDAAVYKDGVKQSSLVNVQTAEEAANNYNHFLLDSKSTAQDNQFRIFPRPDNQFKGTVTANAPTDGLTKTFNVYLYNSWGSSCAGIIFNNDGTKTILSNAQESQADIVYNPNEDYLGECQFFNDLSYQVGTCDSYTWGEKLYNVKNVDISKLVFNNVDKYMKDNTIYVAKVKNGYVKIVRISVWPGNGGSGGSISYLVYELISNEDVASGKGFMQ